MRRWVGMLATERQLPLAAARLQAQAPRRAVRAAGEGKCGGARSRALGGFGAELLGKAAFGWRAAAPCVGAGEKDCEL